MYALVEELAAVYRRVSSALADRDADRVGRDVLGGPPPALSILDAYARMFPRTRSSRADPRLKRWGIAPISCVAAGKSADGRQTFVSLFFERENGSWKLGDRRQQAVFCPGPGARVRTSRSSRSCFGKDAEMWLDKHGIDASMMEAAARDAVNESAYTVREVEPPTPTISSNHGPDYSRGRPPVEKARELVASGALVKVLMLPAEFGGTDVPQNALFVPAWAANEKGRIDLKIVAPLVASGTTRYSAKPEYEGRSCIPTSINIRAWRASDPAPLEASIARFGAKDRSGALTAVSLELRVPRLTARAPPAANRGGDSGDRRGPPR